MAIVVKQASNTPLMLGQLAETLANTYLQHNQQKQQWDKYEQERVWKNEERVWRNEDRAQGQASYDSVMGADPSTFGGAVFQQNAATRAKAGNDISGYLPSTSTSPVPAHIYKNQQLNSYYDPNSTITDSQRQAIDSQYGITPPASTSSVPAHIYKNQQINSYYDPNSTLTDSQRQAIDSQYGIT